ncbi:MAG: hypothetical protein H6Q00_2931, partial [Holophagaceae bacterium]|nr:hypothetical protein [Holophagaceae bacterium]
MSGHCVFRALVGLTLAVGLPAQGPEDAEALVKEAVVYAKAHGTYGLIKAVNTPDGPFRKGSLYIWMVDLEGVTVANARNPGLAGKDDSERKD